MGHDDVASSYPISTGFCRLTGCQRDPRDRGVTLIDEQKLQAMIRSLLQGLEHLKIHLTHNENTFDPQ